MQYFKNYLRNFSSHLNIALNVLNALLWRLIINMGTWLDS